MQGCAGVVMVIYLEEAVARKRAGGTREALHQAVIEGASAAARNTQAKRGNESCVIKNAHHQRRKKREESGIAADSKTFTNPTAAGSRDGCT